MKLVLMFLVVVFFTVGCSDASPPTAPERNDQGVYEGLAEYESNLKEWCEGKESLNTCAKLIAELYEMQRINNYNRK